VTPTKAAPLAGAERKLMAQEFFLPLIGLVLALFCARPSDAQVLTQGGDVADNKVGVATRQVLPRGSYNWRGAPGQSLF
jgi:hypothetical protein